MWIYWVLVGAMLLLTGGYFVRTGYLVYREYKDSVVKQDPLDLFIEALINRGLR